MRIKIDRINFVRDTVSGKDRLDHEHEFYFDQETKIRQTASETTERPLFQILDESGGVNFPLQRDQEVVVTWKQHPRLAGKKLAVRIVVAAPR